MLRPKGYRLEFSWLLPRTATLCVLILTGLVLSAPVIQSASAAAGTFTISQIEPDAARKQVLISFSTPVNMELLRKEMRVFPYVSIYWYRSQQLSKRKILLLGGFRYGQRYVISFPERFTLNGAVYRKTINHFRMPDRPPETLWAEPGTVIERDSRQLLHLRVVNCPRIMVRTVNVPPLLLPVALAAVEQREPFQWSTFLNQLQEQQTRARQALDSPEAGSPPMEPLVQKSALFFTSGEKNEEKPFSVPLTFRPHPEKGSIQLIEILAADGKKTVRPTLQLFRLTDIGLTAKLTPSSLLVWATSLHRGDPLAGIDLLAIDTEGNIFRLGRTKPDGVLLLSGATSESRTAARLKLPVLRWKNRFQTGHQELSIGSVRVIVALTKDDASYIRIGPLHALAFDDVKSVFSPRNKQKLLKAVIFTERGVYRPGSDVHFKAVVRRFRDGRVAAAVGRFGFRITDARGQVIYDRNLDLSAFGSAWDTLHLPSYSPLGTYNLEIQDKTKGKKPATLADATFQVQEFRAPRHKVRIQCRRDLQPASDYVNLKHLQPLVRITIDGIYYAGGPVRHGQVRWRMYHSSCRFKVADQNGFSFGYLSDDEPRLLETGEALLDEKGRLVVRFPLDHDVLTGKRGLLISATVVDFDGRTATETTTFQVRPRFLVGIGPHPQQIQAETKQTFGIRVIDRAGKRIPSGMVKAALFRRSGTYVRTRNAEGNLVWNYEDVWRRLYSADVAIKEGQAAFDLEPAQGGDYLLSFTYRDDRGEAYTSAIPVEVVGDRFWVAYENRDQNFQRLAMAADRGSYRPGETAKITVAPRQPLRWALLTREQDDIVGYSVLSAEQLRDPIPVPITDNALPNLFVSLLTVSGRGRFPLYSRQYDSGAPAFQWGMVNLAVERAPVDLKVTVASENGIFQAEPGSETTLNIQVKDDQGRSVACEMAVAVINEAVLALTRFKTPSLAELRRFDAPLGVFTSDLRALLLRQSPFHLVRSEALTGGGDEETEAPLAGVRRNFRPVAFFDPAVMTDSSGKATVRFKLPDTMTTYRVYVVACDKTSRFATVDRSLVVSKTFYLEPGLPRFFHVGDRFRFPVLVFNRGQEKGTAELRWQSGPELKLPAGSAQQDLAGPGSARIRIAGSAIHAGNARLLFQGSFARRRDRVAVAIPVAPAWILGSSVSQGSFIDTAKLRAPVSRESLKIDWNKIGFDHVKATLELSANPLLLVSGPLHYLLHYPYGCVEQTASAVIALSGLQALIASGSVPGFTKDQALPYLNKGIARLLAMQTESGGFGYWPGYQEPHPWGTLYAAAALSLAADNGDRVPRKALDKAAAYIERQAGNRSLPQLYRAFSTYVLALTDHVKPRAIESLLRESPEMERLEQILVLLAADRQLILPPQRLARRVRRCLLSAHRTSSYPIFNGKYLEPAFALLLASRVIPDDTFTMKAERNLIGRLKHRDHWTSTSDTGWVLLALAQHLKRLRHTQRNPTLIVRYGSHRLESNTFDVTGCRQIILDPRTIMTTPLVRVRSNADFPIFYRITIQYPRVDVERKGAAHGLRVTKKIQALDANTPIRLGDIVKVVIDVELDHGPQHDLILDDPLPAGLVAVNSALEAEEPIENISQDAYEAQYLTRDGYYRLRPNHLEIRDQKVIAYRDVMWQGAYRFEYYARAVCEGRFKVPPTRVEAMYEPRVNGYSSATTLAIQAQD